MNKTPEACLTIATLTVAEGETLITNAGAATINLTRAISLVFQITVTYGSAADDGLTLRLYPLYESDTDTADTAAWDSWDVPFTVDSTILAHWPQADEQKPLPAYMRVTLENDSAGGANTDATSIVVRAIALTL